MSAQFLRDQAQMKKQIDDLIEQLRQLKAEMEELAKKTRKTLSLKDPNGQRQTGSSN